MLEDLTDIVAIWCTESCGPKKCRVVAQAIVSHCSDAQTTSETQRSFIAPYSGRKSLFALAPVFQNPGALSMTGYLGSSKMTPMVSPHQDYLSAKIRLCDDSCARQAIRVLQCAIHCHKMKSG